MSDAAPFIGGWTKHAHARVQERFLVCPTDAEWTEVVASIRNAPHTATPTALFVSNEDHGRQRWRVRLCGKDIAVIWSTASKCVVTVVTPFRLSKEMKKTMAAKAKKRRSGPRLGAHRSAGDE